ncbi:MAG: long-chain fatty acid--CoA ligase, partial [Alphaproteobacteria bacterium]
MDFSERYNAWQSLPQMFFARAAELGDKPLFWHKQGQEWHSISWAEARERVSALSRGLRALGVTPGDRVALVAENRPEWAIADLAIMAARAMTVPAYTTNTVADHVHILGDSGAKLAIVSSAALAERLLPAALQVESTGGVICLEPSRSKADGLGLEGWDDVLDRGRAQPDDVEAYVAAIKRGDTCCLIYTSGTGGAPKGVMLSHGAIICNAKGGYHLFRDDDLLDLDREVFLSFLPLSHSYEHTAGLYFPISIGAEIYYAESVDKLVANMAEARPTIMTAVPRLYESMHQRIISGVRRKGGLSEALFMKAVELGRRRYEQGPAGLSVGGRMLDRLLDKLVRAKVAGRFGGRLKAFVSGGAPLNYDIGVFFVALGVRLLQGYGQTETAPVVSANRPSRIRIHTVGPPFTDVEVKIAGDGEILVRGELTMQGYWNNPEATAEALKDGWVHTGDIGDIDDDGYLRITDRKKDIIVLSGGDTLSPQRVEGMLTFEPELAQAMVYGDRQSHLVALLVPDADF